MEQILTVGIDKFVYTMGWKKPSDVARWRNNKLRIGVCCDCKDQFIPMIMQHNFGLCPHCKPNYSVEAIRKFLDRQMSVSQRYEGAQQDLLMDFFIMLYSDSNLRSLFKKGTVTAKEYEAIQTGTSNDQS